MSVTDVFAVYTHDVVMEGGGSRQLQTRQRPQIIFSEGGVPTHLVSGAALLSRLLPNPQRSCAQQFNGASFEGEPPRYRCRLGCILLKVGAICVADREQRRPAGPHAYDGVPLQGWSIRMNGSYTAVSTPFLALFPPFFRCLFALSGFLASRRRERPKDGGKWAKNGRNRGAETPRIIRILQPCSASQAPTAGSRTR